MSAKERFEKNCEMFDEWISNLLLAHGYWEGCYEYFLNVMKADIKPTQRALLKDLREWWQIW